MVLHRVLAFPLRASTYITVPHGNQRFILTVQPTFCHAPSRLEYCTDSESCLVEEVTDSSNRNQASLRGREGLSRYKVFFVHFTFFHRIQHVYEKLWWRQFSVLEFVPTFGQCQDGLWPSVQETNGQYWCPQDSIWPACLALNFIARSAGPLPPAEEEQSSSERPSRFFPRL